MRNSFVTFRTLSMNAFDVTVFAISDALKNIFTLMMNQFSSDPVLGSENNTGFTNRLKGFNFNSRKTKNSVKKAAKIILPLLFIVIVVLVTREALKATANNSDPAVAGAKIDVKDAKAKEELNKTFTFPLKDSQGKDAGSFTYVLQSAELRDQIIIQGKTASAVEGREFLIVNLKINNSLDKPIQINSRDFIRLSVNGNEKEWLAPEIHNDPVEVQAISTKYTRVGFAINTTDKDLILQIGEINGKKERVKLNLH